MPQVSPYLQSLFGTKKALYFLNTVFALKECYLYRWNFDVLRFPTRKSKSFHLNPLVGNCHGQSVIKAQTSLLHSSAESRHP